MLFCSSMLFLLATSRVISNSVIVICIFLRMRCTSVLSFVSASTKRELSWSISIDICFLGKTSSMDKRNDKCRPIYSISYLTHSSSSSFSVKRRSMSWRYWFISAAIRWARCSSALRAFQMQTGWTLRSNIKSYLAERKIQKLIVSYRFRFLVSGSQFLALIFQTTILNF